MSVVGNLREISIAVDCEDVSFSCSERCDTATLENVFPHPHKKLSGRVRDRNSEIEFADLFRQGSSISFEKKE